MSGELHIRVDPGLYQQRDRWFNTPVTVQMSDPAPDGGIELMFTSHPRLWLVTAPWDRRYIVRAHTPGEAIDRVMNDQDDVDHAVRATGAEIGHKREELHAEELTLQGECGVIAQ